MQKAIYENYSMIMLFGSLKEAIWMVNKSVSGTVKYEYDMKYVSENELVSHFSLIKREILTVLGNIKEINDILLSEEKKAVVVTSYKNYDFYNNCIITHNDVSDDIFIYCDRTYHNASYYFEKWKNKQLYYRYMVYENMPVLIIKLEEKRFFLLPMTSIVAIEAEEDMRNNRKNMKMCCNVEGQEYDSHIITDETMRDKIDTVINCLFFITKK